MSQNQFNGLYGNAKKVLELFDDGLRIYDLELLQPNSIPTYLDMLDYTTNLCTGHGCNGCYQRFIADCRLGGSCVPKNERDLFGEYFVGHMLEQELLGSGCFDDLDCRDGFECFAPTPESLNDLLEE